MEENHQEAPAREVSNVHGQLAQNCLFGEPNLQQKVFSCLLNPNFIGVGKNEHSEVPNSVVGDVYGCQSDQSNLNNQHFGCSDAIEISLEDTCVMFFPVSDEKCSHAAINVNEEKESCAASQTLECDENRANHGNGITTMVIELAQR